MTCAKCDDKGRYCEGLDGPEVVCDCDTGKALIHTEAVMRFVSTPASKACCQCHRPVTEDSLLVGGIHVYYKECAIGAGLAYHPEVLKTAEERSAHRTAARAAEASSLIPNRQADVKSEAQRLSERMGRVENAVSQMLYKMDSLHAILDTMAKVLALLEKGIDR